MITPQQFAFRTGANVGFSPPHPEEWMIFWQEDICKDDKYDIDTCFPQLSLPEARRAWLAMEEHFFANYDDILRVWPEWGSSGIWAPPYPGSLRAGGMVDYEDLPLPPHLVERFTSWQAIYDESPPGGRIELDWDRFQEVADELTRELKKCVGPRVYVERRELIEVLMDGTTRSWRPLLGLPDSE